MTSKRTTLRILQATVSVAAIAVGSAAYAQDAETYTLDQSDLGATDIQNINTLIAAAVEGATSNLNAQTAVATANSISVDVDLPQDIDVQAINQSVESDIDLAAGNFNFATSTFGDTSASGTQTAFASLNTVDVSVLGEVASVDLTQDVGLDGNTTDILVGNAMVAGAAALGTAAITGTVDADGDDIASRQTAAISLNTASFDTDQGALLVNLGDIQAVEDADLGGINYAQAYAPAPLVGNGDPSIDDLEQVVAITVNSLGFGEAVVDDTDPDNIITTADATDFNLNILYNGPDILEEDGSYDISDIGADASDVDYESGQFFDGGDGVVLLDNAAVATTFQDVGDLGLGVVTAWDEVQDNFAEVEDLYELDLANEGVGPVSLEAGLQATQLSVNSIDSAGNLTISSTLIPIVTDIDPDPVDVTLAPVLDVEGDPIKVEGGFTQELANLNDGSDPTLNPFDNLAFAATGLGDADVSDYVQVASIAGNSISTLGDLTLATEVDQDVLGSDLNLVNATGSYVAGEGDATIADVVQQATASLNTISADGAVDLGENFDQDIDDSTFFLANVADAETLDGVSEVTDVVQQASLTLNSLTAGGALAGLDADQDFDGAGDIELTNVATSGDSLLGDLLGAPLNVGSASMSGITQIGQANINSISADTFGGLNVFQDTSALDLEITNTAGAFVDVGSYPISGNTAAVSGAVQAAIARVNNITN